MMVMGLVVVQGEWVGDAINPPEGIYEGGGVSGEGGFGGAIKPPFTDR